MLRRAALALLLAGCAGPSAEVETSSIHEVGVSTASPSRSSPTAPAGPLLWPVTAPVTSLFGPRDGRAHEGIDLSVPDGTPVHAAAAGQVAYAGTKLRGYGRLLILDHGGGLTTVYAHNQELLVTEGDRVSAGQLISRSGHSGRVTAPHLHFEVRVGGRAQDPLKYLDVRRQAVAHAY